MKMKVFDKHYKIGMSKKRKEEETHTQHDEIQLLQWKVQFWIEIKIGRVKEEDRTQPQSQK